MIQAGGNNPLVAMLTSAGGGSALPAQGVAKGPAEGSVSGFAALFASAQGNAGEVTTDSAGGNQLLPTLEGLLTNLDELKAAVAATDGLPSDVSESILETLENLSSVVASWIDGQPVNAEDLANLLPEGIETLLPEGLAATISNDLVDGLTLDYVPPVVLVHVLQQATLSVVSDLSSAVSGEQGAAELSQPLNLGQLVSAIGKIQRLLAPQQSPAQHPVALAPQLAQGDDLEVDAQSRADLATPQGKANGPSQASLAFGAFMQRLASSAAASAGAIDIPKDMVQVVPEALTSALQSISETQSSASQAQASARPDAPQAKFTQAIIGQLRSIDLQDGTTRVELNPRGLGSVEIEMKTNVDGSLSVVVRAESAHVLNSLRDESDLLAQIIAQGGEASVDLQEFSSGDQQSFDGQSGLNSEVTAGENTEELHDETVEQATIGNGQLDLMT